MQRRSIDKALAMAESTSSSDSDRHARIQKSVLRSKHQELRDKLNFHSIYPHLNAHGLLPTSLNQVELVDELGSSQRKIDKVLAHMPDCGKPDFLDDFIVCLKVSNDGTGDAHSELAETIEKAYKSELDRSVSPEIIGMSVTVNVHEKSGPHRLFTGIPRRAFSSTNLKNCICYCAPIAVMILIITLTVVILLSVPGVSDIAYTPNVTASETVIEVKFESKAAFWIAEASISVNGCDSSVIVVQGRMCNSLPTTKRNVEGYDILVALSPIYFLENSRMNLSNVEFNSTNCHNTIIWILNEKDYLESKNFSGNSINIKKECDIEHECPRRMHAGESCCYHIQDYAGGNILHQIAKSDFYFTMPWPKPSCHTFDVFYTAVVYDLNAIIHLPGAEVFPAKTAAKISDWLKFDSTKCILLNTTCPITFSGFSPITVSNVSKRKDVLVFVLTLEIVISIIVGAVLTLLCKLTLLKGRWTRAKRSSVTFEEMEPSDTTPLTESNNSTQGNVYSVTVSTNTFRGMRSL